MTENAPEPLGRTQALGRPGTPKPTQNAPRGQPGASKLVNGVWLYIPTRPNEGGESFPPECYAADLLSLLAEETDKWGVDHTITHGEWEQAVVDKYREYFGPADLAITPRGRVRWKEELRAAKIKLTRTGQIITGRTRIKNKWYGWIKLKTQS